LALVAEYDNNTRAEKTSEGMKTRLENGYWGWGAPLGYKNVKDKLGNKVIILDSEKADSIKSIFEEYAKGIYTFKELAQR